MKHVLKLCVFQFFNVFLFSFVYYIWLREHLQLPHQKYTVPTYIDCLSYSMAITSGTGVSGIVAITSKSNLVSIVQQGILIGTTTLMVYYLYTLL